MKSPLIFLFIEVDPDVYKAIVVILLTIIVMQFILAILNKVLSYKLKNKIINKNVSEEIAFSLLETQKQDKKQDSAKWVSILFSTGLGIFVTNQFLPLGIHSLGIMTISIALGFLAYSIYLKQTDS